MTKRNKKTSVPNARRNKASVRDIEKIESQSMEDARTGFDKKMSSKVVESNLPKSKRPF